MAKKEIKKRNDVRVTDIPDSLFDIICSEAKDNRRTHGAQIIVMLLNKQKK